MKSFSVQANATIAKKIKGYAEMQMKLNDTTNVLRIEVKSPLEI